MPPYVKPTLRAAKVKKETYLSEIPDSVDGQPCSGNFKRISSEHKVTMDAVKVALSRAADQVKAAKEVANEA